MVCAFMNRILPGLIWMSAVLLRCNAAAEDSLMEKWRQWAQPGLRDAEGQLRALKAERDALPVVDSRPDFSEPGYRSEPAAMPETEKWVQVDLGRVMPVDDIVLMPCLLYTSPSPRD